MYSILVIDDESAILSLLKQVLQRQGYRVVTTCNGREGIAEFDAGLFNLVIMDVRMPGMKADQILRHIRNHHQYTPVIGISGTPWMNRGLSFDNFLAKPFSIKHLLRTIKQIECSPNTLSQTPIPNTSIQLISSDSPVPESTHLQKAVL